MYYGKQMVEQGFYEYFQTPVRAAICNVSLQKYMYVNSQGGIHERGGRTRTPWVRR